MKEQEIMTAGGVHVTTDEALRRIVPEMPSSTTADVPDGKFEQAASRVNLIEGFMDPDLSEKIFARAIEKRNMTIPEILLLSMAGGLASGSMGNPEDKVFGASAKTSYPATPMGSSENDWSSSGYQSTGLTPAQRTKMWSRSRDLGTKDGMLFSLLRRMVVHTCGKGPWLFVKKQENAGPAETKRFNLLDQRKEKLFPNFGKLVKLLVWQTFLNGTLPVLHFPVDGFAGIGSRPQIRPLIPDYITKLHVADEWSLWPVISGCTFDILKGAREDTPRGYVPRKACTLLRIHEEGNDGIWGLSVPFHIITELMRYMDWLEQRRLKSRVDNMTLIIRYLESAETMSKREIPNRPMVIDAPMGKEKWEQLSTSSGSSRDATGGDGREFRLRMSSASGWAEHYLTGNAQYAAQMGKDAFPTFLLEYYQGTMEDGLLEMAAKTLGCGKHELEIAWPPVDMRDRGAKVNELTSLFKERIVSRSQVHRDLGYDHDRNERELDDELSAELTAGPTGGASNFGGMGMPSGLFPSATEGVGAAPPSPAGIPAGAEVTLPSGLTAPLKTILVPRTLRNGQTVFIQAAVPIQAAIPADTFAGKMKLIGGQSDLGVTTDDIIETLPEFKNEPIGMISGTDYGYAAEGAAVFGGESVDGDLVVAGEATFKRVKSQDTVPVYNEVKERYPQFKYIFTGSDEPEYTDTLNDAGFIAEKKHIGEDRTRALIMGSGKRVLIHYECLELLSDLFPDAAAKIAGTNVQGRHDHKDAFRYWIVGLLEMLGINEKV